MAMGFMGFFGLLGTLVSIVATIIIVVLLILVLRVPHRFLVLQTTLTQLKIDEARRAVDKELLS